MSLQVTCPHCGRRFSVPDRHAGGLGRCPCGAEVAIPGPAAPSSATESAHAPGSRAGSPGTGTDVASMSGGRTITGTGGRMRNSRFVGWFFALFGGLFTLIGALTLAPYAAAARWPTTTARLLSAAVDSHFPPDPSNPEAVATYCPSVRYRYVVGGVTYEGSPYKAVSVGKVEASAAVRALEEQQRRDGHITIHYDPGQPSRSAASVALVTVPGLIFVAMGSTFALIGLSIVTTGRARVALTGLGFGNVVGVTPACVAVWRTGMAAWWMPALWASCLLGFSLLARRDPNYVHAEELAALPPAPTTATAPGKPALRAPRDNSSPAPVKWTEEQRRAALRTARWVGLGIGLFFAAPFIVLSVVAARDEHLDGFYFFGGFALAAGALTGGLAGAGVYLRLRAMHRHLGTLAQRVDVVAEFARQVGGTVELRREHLLVTSWLLPHGVAFRHRGLAARLMVKAADELSDESSETCFSFESAALQSVRCRVSPRGPNRKRLAGGWPLFDDFFDAEMDAAVATRAPISHAVQQELLQFKRWLSEHDLWGDIELEFGGGTFLLRVGSAPQTLEDLMGLYEFATRILDELTREASHAQ